MIYRNDTKTLGMLTASGVIASLFIPVWAPAIGTMAIMTMYSAYQDSQKKPKE